MRFISNTPDTLLPAAGLRCLHRHDHDSWTVITESGQSIAADEHAVFTAFGEIIAAAAGWQALTLRSPEVVKTTGHNAIDLDPIIAWCVLDGKILPITALGLRTDHHGVVAPDGRMRARTGLSYDSIDAFQRDERARRSATP